MDPIWSTPSDTGVETGVEKMSSSDTGILFGFMA